MCEYKKGKLSGKVLLGKVGVRGSRYCHEGFSKIEIVMMEVKDA